MDTRQLEKLADDLSFLSLLNPMIAEQLLVDKIFLYKCTRESASQAGVDTSETDKQVSQINYFNKNRDYPVVWQAPPIPYDFYTRPWKKLRN